MNVGSVSQTSVVIGASTDGFVGGPRGFVDHSVPNGGEFAHVAKGVRLEEKSSVGYVDEDMGTDASTDVASGDENSLGESEFAVVADAPRTYTIFDWDDTIFPTTWIQTKGLMTQGANEDEVADLERLAVFVMASLRLALKSNGKVVIVTNGDAGWVELSMRHFMPSIEPLLTEGDIDIISARSLFEPTGVCCPFEWKRLTFAQLLEAYYGSDEGRNIVCLGDSMHEHHAIATATKDMHDCRTKTVKFVVRPDIECLCKQHERLVLFYESVVNLGGSEHFLV